MENNSERKFRDIFAETVQIIGGMAVNSLGQRIFGEPPVVKLARKAELRAALDAEVDAQLANLPTAQPIALPPVPTEL